MLFLAQNMFNFAVRLCIIRAILNFIYFISTNSKVIATTAIQAPATNLVTMTTSSTAPVATNPIVLTIRERIIVRRAAGSVSLRSNRVQCRTMPIWLRVNEMNTPTM